MGLENVAFGCVATGEEDWRPEEVDPEAPEAEELDAEELAPAWPPLLNVGGAAHKNSAAIKIASLLETILRSRCSGRDDSRAWPALIESEPTLSIVVSTRFFTRTGTPLRSRTR
jgi:hypothetical protein